MMHAELVGAALGSFFRGIKNGASCTRSLLHAAARPGSDPAGIYIGWLLHRRAGGVLPGCCSAAIAAS